MSRRSFTGFARLRKLMVAAGLVTWVFSGLVVSFAHRRRRVKRVYSGKWVHLLEMCKNGEKNRDRGEGKGSSELLWSELWVLGSGRLTCSFGVSFGLVSGCVGSEKKGRMGSFGLVVGYL
ncbi:hypothetical protein H5410_041345 [Solanum commersonii]|uniref:Transmembrane protein n=1 Tax=Solanum commersonii TaxID=4109 RepID=A0A9J5XTC9_SOLCO|nr:hypothetical protein H5410_041345 [Solanum commersonii]